ncbi:LPS export ABC transporter periplasmic protein LptC [Prolixibacteraceae bacterium Z1-6]|uniref:LPS export ABC transporter periplasmic protein LptC n=1 Tax=Draconibacterium aestuarii TaxID=2998507 RepID=A0A9X3J584_9BACT|nr:LPS export ABC transporter periplasmic protein LptC [Prolixibacteraceae bacterium Z1-6]
MKIRKLDSRIFQHIKNIYIAVLVMGTAILFYACNNNNIDKIQAFNTQENLPIQEAINFETIYTDSGQVRFSLKTPKLLRFENDGKEYTEFPIGMQLIKYDANQNIISSITADYAKQFVKDSKWEAKNNVVVTNAQGDSLKTEHLIWEEKTEKIYTEEFVRIIRDNQTITGIGLVSDQDMLNWKIKNPQGTILIDVDKSNAPVEPDKQPAPPADMHKSKQPETQKLQFK